MTLGIAMNSISGVGRDAGCLYVPKPQCTRIHLLKPKSIPNALKNMNEKRG